MRDEGAKKIIRASGNAMFYQMTCALVFSAARQFSQYLGQTTLTSTDHGKLERLFSRHGVHNKH